MEVERRAIQDRQRVNPIRSSKSVGLLRRAALHSEANVEALWFSLAKDLDFGPGDRRLKSGWSANPHRIEKHGDSLRKNRGKPNA